MLVRRTPEDLAPSVIAAVDLSPRSAKVIEWARTAAAGGSLYVYHAYQVPFATRLEAYGISKAATELYSEDEYVKREADLAALVDSATSTPPASRMLERGDPARLLSRYIQTIEPSLVVLGQHVPGSPKSTSSSVGSVCRYITNAAPVNILVVPPCEEGVNEPGSAPRAL
jgi:nucleotide-binding universal stress UspA family protein